VTRRFLASVVVILMALSSSLAQEKVKLPEGQPPHFFVVTEARKDGLVIQRRPLPTKAIDVPLIEYKLAFKTLRASDARGKVLVADEVAKRLKPGRVVLVSADDDEPVPAPFLTVIKDDAVILIEVIPQPRGESGRPVPQPRGKERRQPEAFAQGLTVTIVGERGAGVVQKALEGLRRIKANEPKMGDPEKGQGISATITVRPGTPSRQVTAVVTELLDAGVSSVTIQVRK
jgi:hypothetical protein